MKWSCGFWLHPSFLKKHQWVSFVYFVLWEGVSWNLNWLKTLQVDEADLKVFLPSTSKVLELQACMHTRPSNPFYVLLPGHRRMQFWVLYLKELMGGHMSPALERWSREIRNSVILTYTASQGWPELQETLCQDKQTNRKGGTKVSPHNIESTQNI